MHLTPHSLHGKLAEHVSSWEDAVNTKHEYSVVRKSECKLCECSLHQLRWLKLVDNLWHRYKMYVSKQAEPALQCVIVL